MARRFCAVYVFLLWSLANVLRADEPSEWIWHDRWVTSISSGTGDSLYASLATGMPQKEGSVVRFSGANPDNATELYRQPAAVWAVATSPDKSMLASTDFQGSLAVTRIAGGEAQHFSKAFTNWTRALAFTKDSKQLVAGNESGIVFAWSIIETKSITSRDLGTGQIMSLAFSPSGEQLAVATSSGKLHLLKYPSLETVKVIEVGSQSIWSVIYGDNDLLWVGIADNTVRRISSDGASLEIAKLNDWVTSLSRLPGGGLVAVSMKGQIKRSSDSDPKSLSEWAVGPKGAWGVYAISSDRIVVATRTLGPAVLHSVGQLEYVAKDAETKKLERKEAAEKAAAAKAEKEKKAEEKLIFEKLAAEKTESARKAQAEKKAQAEQAAAEKAEAEKAATEKVAAEKAAAEKAAAEKASEKKEAEKPKS